MSTKPFALSLSKGGPNVIPSAVEESKASIVPTKPRTAPTRHSREGGNPELIMLTKPFALSLPKRPVTLLSAPSQIQRP